MSGWIGVDLDGTLAKYDTWRGPFHIGEPIVPVLDLVKRLLSEGKQVRIFTARVAALSTGPDWDPDSHLIEEAAIAKKVIEQWCEEHIGRILPVTALKDFGMIALIDDRAVAAEHNTGALFHWGDAPY